ncbi:transcription-repair coupling factor, partial [Treponema sp. R6D11]
LYIPVNQLDMIYKWQAREGAETRLSRLGTLSWENAKNRAKKAVEDIADELIELYAERLKLIGHKFSVDDERQIDFENDFIFEETPDQINAIEEIKEDMMSSTPMDRLLCGDVGYGKTEVAMRAAYKAVLDKMQVAYLVPTTVLCLQHYKTFQRRFEKHGIKVEMLSRLRTNSEAKEIRRKLEMGEIDIVIGTHALLSQNMKYKNLGFLIIDEEQRFGVKHKEIIKEIKSSIDVLSLSATPIPRSMHMSLVGIRDMSIIETPPAGRLPVATSVIEHDEATINHAIKRELARGGQVYYIHNKISTLPHVLRKLSKSFPDANIKTAHGKMGEVELEDIMLSLLNGDIDILICTSIIETGIDASNVNTIIIEDANKFGLSSLYQLRGRVGRSARQGYCVLTFKPDKVLTEEAEKRLKAIMEFTEFGSGFKIALKDLEIRGAGNVIGAQQSGHIENIGYDMYCRMLSDSISARKGEKKEKIKARIDIKVSGFIPERYIESDKLRIETYKMIMELENIEDGTEFLLMLKDRYGEPDASVESLVGIQVLKEVATNTNVLDIKQRENDLIIRFREPPKVEKIFEAIDKSNGKLVFSASNTPYLTYRGFTQEKIKDVTVLLHLLKN